MIARFNAWLALRVADILATMWVFWVLNLAVFLALAIERPANAQGWVLFWVSIWFQGVALPALAFVSKIQGDRLEKTVRDTHDAVMQELAEVKAMRAEVHDIGEDTDALRTKEGIPDG